AAVSVYPRQNRTAQPPSRVTIPTHPRRGFWMPFPQLSQDFAHAESVPSYPARSTHQLTKAEHQAELDPLVAPQRSDDLALDSRVGPDIQRLGDHATSLAGHVALLPVSSCVSGRRTPPWAPAATRCF